MTKKNNKKLRFKSLNSKADTSSAPSSPMQWRDWAFFLSIGLSIFWIARLLLLQMVFKFTSDSVVTLDSTNGAMQVAVLITVALYTVFLIAWLQVSEDKLSRLKTVCILLAFFGIDLFQLRESVEFLNRWQSTPLGEKVVYAHQFSEMKPPTKLHSNWHTCSYLMFEYGKELVTYPFPHPDHVSKGNVCIDVREGLFGLKWTEHIRNCKPASTQNQRIESSDLQTACKPSAAGMKISLDELRSFKANSTQR